MRDNLKIILKTHLFIIDKVFSVIKMRYDLKGRCFFATGRNLLRCYFYKNNIETWISPKLCPKLETF